MGGWDKVVEGSEGSSCVRAKSLSLEAGLASCDTAGKRLVEM